MANLQAAVPKSTDNIISQRFNYKKALNNENESQHVPQILSNQTGKFIKPRILKTTTPYKSEKKEIIKKLSEKEMHFEDLNSFKVIYKFEEEDKNKLPAINNTNKLNSDTSSQNSFNNTFNPFNQSIKTKMNLENNDFKLSDKKLFKNPTSQKITTFNNNPSFNHNLNKQPMININKINVISEYYQNEQTGSGKQQDKKSNQNYNKTGKLEPIQFNEGSSKNLRGEFKSGPEKEVSNIQKIKFPKEIFCSNIPKKYIV